ncbi:hypothetical protein JB92DRAFT_2832827 [Gautieria morchelliformis]|nr:hypothetical protein JB92DRAFT_2832827 [Gautieria morchelliformis]
MAMSWLNGSCISPPEDSNSSIKPQDPRSKFRWPVPMVRKEASPLLSCLTFLDDKGTDRARPAGASSKKIKARVWIPSRGGCQHFSRVDIRVVKIISMLDQPLRQSGSMPQLWGFWYLCHILNAPPEGLCVRAVQAHNGTLLFSPGRLANAKPSMNLERWLQGAYPFLGKAGGQGESHNKTRIRIRVPSV